MHARLIETALASVFLREWQMLPEDDRSLVIRDCSENDVPDFVEYRQSIGKGNLQTYANTLRVGLRKDT